MFNFVPSDSILEEIESIDSSKGRFYTTPEGNIYPSVTTFLSSFGNESLNEWKKSIGKEISDSISESALTRGRRIHFVMEKYLKSALNRKDFSKSLVPNLRQIFFDMEKTTQRINNIHYIEKGLYSDRLKLAGRVDLIAEFDNKLSIIDYKGSTIEKSEIDIEKYFLQTAAYGIMYKEQTVYDADQLVIIMLCDDMPFPKVFKESASKYHGKLLNLVDEFHKKRKQNAKSNSIPFII